MRSLFRTTCRVAVTLVASGCLLTPSLVAQTTDATFSSASRFMPRDGEVLYKSSCQACHMAAGEGAAGAAVYPPLASNTKLRTARYAAVVVVRGQKAMPSFAGQMDDEQVAAVVNYVRTHFGNDYKDALSAADVKAARQ